MNLKTLIKKHMKMEYIIPERIDALDRKMNYPKSWKYRHIYRYNIAKNYSLSKKVLDIIKIESEYMMFPHKIIQQVISVLGFIFPIITLVPTHLGRKYPYECQKEE